MRRSVKRKLAPYDLRIDPFPVLGFDNIGLAECFSGNCSAGEGLLNTCKDYALGIGEAAGMTLDWFLGIGPENRIFGEDDRFTQLMKTDGCVAKAREFWRKKNAGKTCCDKLLPVTRYDCPFGVFELIGAGINPAQQFVGTYKVDIIPRGDTVRFYIRNKTSLTSGSYGLLPSWDRGTFPTPCGNMNQTYTWTESCSEALGQ